MMALIGQVARNHNKTHLLAASVAVIALAALPNELLAQSASAGDSQSGSSSEVGLADIVVTATRRPERLQDVPLSVTAVSGETIQKSSFTQLSDLKYLSPGLNFTGTAPFANSGGFVIRGIGTQASNYATEQTVGIVVDGVVLGMPRDPGATGFSDVDRVEILRGPQGTLFGKNSSAGLVSIVTNQPELQKFAFDGHARYGSRNEIIAQGNLNIPLGDQVAARISSYYQAQDGKIPNVFADWHVGDNKSYGVRGKLRYEPSGTLTISLSGEYQHLFARDTAFLYKFGSSPAFRAAFDGLDADPSKELRSYSNEPWTAKSTVYGFSGQIDLDVGDHKLTSITAYRHFALEQIADLDASPVDYFDHSITLNHDRQITQEVRLTSPSDGRLKYVLGIYFYDTKIRADETQYGALGFAPLQFSFTGGGTNHYLVRTKSQAVFGQATYNLTDSFRLIGGLRFTHDKVSSDIDFTAIPGLIPLNTTTVAFGSTSKSNLSGKAGAQFDFTRNVMAYATFSRGYKGPAINIIQGNADKLRPEISDSYELGVKSTLLGGRVTLNGALFWETFKDFQAQTLTPTLPYSIKLLNAPKLRTRGFELEAHGRLSDALTLSGNLSYADARFQDFTGVCYSGEPVSTVPGVGCYTVSPGVTAANRAGYRLANSPHWTYGISAAYDAPVFNDYRLSANATWSWQSDILQSDLNPANATRAYGILNAGVRGGPDSGAWSIGVYARNLFNKHFYALTGNALDPGGQGAFVSQNAYRTIGVSLDLSL